ncbi:hypothetical protein RvY_17665-2 [Ramazzottius varieornatus]|uniref:MRH domain-containing protein n=1 Tax=Ramazzottius varieornatus TaxID=947166 RepID=A0A1D1W8P2_RAMVA|nr:hypothetical protein RvY_17665-2 [Ramazzottius varieornatus]
MDLLRSFLPFLALLLCIAVSSVSSQCDRINNMEFTERQATIDALNHLPADLRNKKFTSVEAKPKGNGNYTYTFQICPDKDKATDFAGAVQIDDDPGKTTRVMGRFNETDAILSPRGDLLSLIYTSGDNYTNACGKSERRAIVIIRCNDGIHEGDLDMLAEAAGTGEDFCHYMLELTLPPGSLPGLLKYCTSMGSSPDPGHHLSAGSVVLIIILVTTVAFLAIGSIYKRYVAGAQGWEQIPFIDFFRRCGSLQADGWKFVTGRGRSVHSNRYDGYSSVSTDEERQPALDRHNNDDHLLPM